MSLSRSTRLSACPSPAPRPNQARVAFTCLLAVILAGTASLRASEEALLKAHCFDCHNEDKTKGKFKLTDLGDGPTVENFERWVEALDLVSAEEMPPEDDSELSMSDRQKLAAWLEENVKSFEATAELIEKTTPRRLNNREFENSIRDVLLIEDIGTHQPTDNLIGDTLHQGFDTHGDSLGFSRFHLEQYIESARRIVDAVILSGEKPEVRQWEINSRQIVSAHTRQNSKRAERHGRAEGFDFLDPRQLAYFESFKTVPETGRYQIKIRATGKDRLLYETADTGYYNADPIELRVLMGDREKTFELPDEEIMKISLDEWLAKGTRLRLSYPTDAFTMIGNGNFKFQNRIAPKYLKEHHPEVYQQRVEETLQSGKLRNKSAKSVESWHYWTDLWQGARPRIFTVRIEGPIHETWPPARQVALIGKNPKAENATGILAPIAERAWRRPVKEGELDKIAAMVQAKAETLGDVDALKEGIVAVLVSPAFLLQNTEDREPDDQFASKFSFFLQSTIPDKRLLKSVRKGGLDDFESVRDELKKRVASSKAKEFLREFPHAWMELNDINFMSPDPDHYRFYHRKRLSEDMINEVLAFFRHAVENNIPVPEFLSADYSFINADLAAVYGVEDVPEDSQLRKYTFTDGRRGGLLGMGAFLTSTADSLATSPIHRAIYVMENFMGIHPTPPPPDVIIKEPDVRQARTIKEILAAHVSDENCASCHQAIDPWGYAFESFDPTGAWRDAYVIPAILELDEEGNPVSKKRGREAKDTTIPIDASARFRNGNEYKDITEYRKQVLTEANRDRFVRCFISKLLTYANGREPTKADYSAIDAILSKSAEHDYRVIETIAAVIDSPLFREE